MLMDRTFFFRNVTNLLELKVKTQGKLQASAYPTMYKVIAEIELDLCSFNHFCSDFSKNFIPMYKYINSMEVDVSGVWKCLAVYNNQASDIILINSNGYSYPRFTAIKII